MILKTQFGEFVVHFNHPFEKAPTRPGKFDEKPELVHHNTICQIHTGPCARNEQTKRCEAESNLGISICGPKDTFSKAIGRKVALVRAIRDFDWKVKEAIWNAYFEIVPKNKK